MAGVQAMLCSCSPLWSLQATTPTWPSRPPCGRTCQRTHLPRSQPAPEAAPGAGSSTQNSWDRPEATFRPLNARNSFKRAIHENIQRCLSSFSQLLSLLHPCHLKTTGLLVLLTLYIDPTSMQEGVAKLQGSLGEGVGPLHTLAPGQPPLPSTESRGSPSLAMKHAPGKPKPLTNHGFQVCEAGAGRNELMQLRAPIVSPCAPSHPRHPLGMEHAVVQCMVFSVAPHSTFVKGMLQRRESLCVSSCAMCKHTAGATL